MLLFICIIILIVGIIIYKINSKKYYSNGVEIFSISLTIISIVTLISSIVIIMVTYIDIKGQVSSHQEQYNILNYQVENNMYDNDFEYGKKELMTEVGNWNAWLASKKALQRDFWIGIYIPNIYDDLELIDYSNMA